MTTALIPPATHPMFAIVGHPNKGKSSIVATLAEDESIAISPDPGTTRLARSFRMRIDDQVLYELFDTPGFQRSRAILAWLRQNERGADARQHVVREFVAQHAGEERYRNEVELLKPIIAGAGILYVVDGAHPYGAEYEPEMEVLRWTGQPRMALINLIGPGNYVEEWRRALNQYFSIVRVFDAQRADFGKRLELLRAFRELGEGNDRFSAALDHAVNVLEADRNERRRRAASEITDLLSDVLSWRETASAPDQADQAQLVTRLSERLMTRVRKREQTARRLVQELYHHLALETQEQAVDVLTEDLFSERSFVVFGLSTKQLAMTGAATGAVAGGVIDVAAGGASLLLGAGLGALIGGMGAVLGANRLAKVQVLGAPMGGMQLQVGPITNPNFPWVMLGRALLHHRLVAERNHARREALVVESASGLHLSDEIAPEVRKRMARAFKKIRDEGGSSAFDRDQLCADVEACIGHV